MTENKKTFGEKAKGFWDKNKKKIIGVGIAIVGGTILGTMEYHKGKKSGYDDGWDNGFDTGMNKSFAMNCFDTDEYNILTDKWEEKYKTYNPESYAEYMVRAPKMLITCASDIEKWHSK